MEEGSVSISVDARDGRVSSAIVVLLLSLDADAWMVRPDAMNVEMLM